MDAFFCSVELLDNPSLQGKPFAVSLQSNAGAITWITVLFRWQVELFLLLPTRRGNTAYVLGWQVRLYVSRVSSVHCPDNVPPSICRQETLPRPHSPQVSL